MIDLKKLKELVKLMAENDLTELDLRDDGEHISLKRGSAQAQPPQVQYVHAPAPAAPPAVPAVQPGAVPAAGSSAGGGETASARDENLVPITSPMVGTFYASPNPEAEAFVQVGSTVDPQTVVCIIEAMKVFNEIKAEVAGTIAEVLVENGQAVEFGQPIFLVRKK